MSPQILPNTPAPGCAEPLLCRSRETRPKATPPCFLAMNELLRNCGYLPLASVSRAAAAFVDLMQLDHIAVRVAQE